MGGLLRAPKVPAAPPPVATPTPTPAPAPATAPAAAPVADTAADADASRRRRGLAGTIATSSRGITDDGRLVPARKTLLGE
jgi:hypothetical protein